MSDVKLIALLYAGATPTQAIDKYMLDEVGMPAEIYAQFRSTTATGVRQSAGKCPEVWDE